MDIFEIKINSEETLLDAFDVLHDAACDENDIKYDPEKGTLDIIFDRDFMEDTSRLSVRRVLFILHRVEFPIVKSRLHLEGIDFCKINSNDNSLGTHTFNACEVKDDKYLLYFCEVLEMELGFKSPVAGYLKDMEFIEGKKGGFFQFRSKLDLPPPDSSM
jgi:hypothetical protein